MSGITFANNKEALDTLNRYKYTANLLGKRMEIHAVATDLIAHTSFRTNLPVRLVFTDTTIRYHGFIQGRDRENPYKLEPSVSDLELVECRKVKEVWVWSKTDMRLRYAKEVEGDYCISFTENRYRYPLAVVIDEDLLPRYIKAISEVFPAAKIYRFKGPIGP